MDIPSLADLCGPLSGNDLESAVVGSLFTDRVAPPEHVGEPRGFWGDDPATPYGSRIWMLERSVIRDGRTVLAQARDYATEALEWLISDNVADRVDVETSWQGSALIISVAVYEPKKTTPRRWDFSHVWSGLSA